MQGEWAVPGGRAGRFSEAQMVSELPSGFFLQCMQLAFLLQHPVFLDKSNKFPHLKKKKSSKYGFGKLTEKTSETHRVRQRGPILLVERGT